MYTLPITDGEKLKCALAFKRFHNRFIYNEIAYIGNMQFKTTKENEIYTVIHENGMIIICLKNANKSYTAADTCIIGKKVLKKILEFVK